MGRESLCTWVSFILRDRAAHVLAPWARPKWRCMIRHYIQGLGWGRNTSQGNCSSWSTFDRYLKQWWRCRMISWALTEMILLVTLLVRSKVESIPLDSASQSPFSVSTATGTCIFTPSLLMLRTTTAISHRDNGYPYYSIHVNTSLIVTAWHLAQSFPRA